MSSKKRIFFVFTALLLIAMVMSTAFAENETIEFWDVNTRAPHVAAFNQVMTNFENETGIKVKKSIFSTSELMTQISTAKAAGTLPDVIMADYGDTQSVSMGLMGVAAPVNDIVNEYGSKYWINPIFVKNASFDGKCYGVPWITFPHVLVYRKDWFDAKGLSAPTTWAQWYAAAKKLTEDTNNDGKIDRWGVVFGFKEGFPFMDLVCSNKDYWWDAKGKPIVGARTKQTIDFFRKMANDTMYPGSVNYTHEDTRLAFTKGTAAMIATSTSYLFPFDRDVPKWFEEGRIAATGIPVNVKGREGTWLGYNSLVAVKGPKEALAKKFIKFVIRKDVAAKYFSNNVAGHVPALSSVWEDQDFWKARDRFKSTYSAALASARATKWDQPIVPWSGIFFSKCGYDKIMDNVYVNKWPTTRVISWLRQNINEVRDNWK